MATVQDFLKNPKWLQHIDEGFNERDQDGDGFVSREDTITSINNLAKAMPNRPSEIAKMRAATLEFTNAMGLNEGVKVDKKKYRELAANIVVAELARIKRGEETLVEKMHDAVFDLLDTNRDGTISFDEYKVYMKACNFPEDAAEGAFALLDKDKSGSVDRKEYMSFFIKFWFHLDDPEAQGMFGSKFD